jgi:hypothetical protein
MQQFQNALEVTQNTGIDAIIYVMDLRDKLSKMDARASTSSAVIQDLTVYHIVHRFDDVAAAVRHVDLGGPFRRPVRND